MAAVTEHNLGMQGAGLGQDGHPAEGLILALWMEEAQRRLEELRTGQVKGIDSVEAFRKAREAVEHSRGLR